jgi:hypothetical protein
MRKREREEKKKEREIKKRKAVHSLLPRQSDQFCHTLL